MLKNKKENLAEIVLQTFSQGTVVLYICEAHGDYAPSFITPNIQSQLGYTDEEFLSEPNFWLSHVHPDDRERILNNVGSLFETGHHTHEYRFQHKNGSYRWMHDQLTLIRDATGTPVEIVGYWLDITMRKEIENALHKSEKELRLLSSQLLTAQENERRRVALDIHDNVAQTLVAMKFRIEHALGNVDHSTEKSAELSSILVPVIQQTIGEVRDIYMRLRPSILDDLGLLATLTWLSREFQSTNPDIQFQSEIDIADSDIPDNLKVVIFRVVQEGLDNVSRHSKADQVRVTLTIENENLELTVLDNGIGISLEEVLSVDDSLRGMGLSGMRERVELVGGTFRIDGEKGKGTQIHASWPT